ncbi:Ankyrin repeat domain-containing protein 1 [Hondaea fermentalgiana]|uniref:Ankyrin repeat domain-containing protein 1 n=1 Tax=Hondaea fermentalgiana TaxID=2315210 RepID=A0A2R5GEM8_9STRA|nr:Ankyrin repeat domain-containing protein 1 [Hondaea fermentalgiana]|eukprot:GBG29386.1 Ankyrin repeat domain-containing protein 1 [Hondaea fermentalgiana]
MPETRKPTHKPKLNIGTRQAHAQASEAANAHPGPSRNQRTRSAEDAHFQSLEPAFAIRPISSASSLVTLRQNNASSSPTAMNAAALAHNLQHPYTYMPPESTDPLVGTRVPGMHASHTGYAGSMHGVGSLQEYYPAQQQQQQQHQHYRPPPHSQQDRAKGAPHLMPQGRLHSNSSSTGSTSSNSHYDSSNLARRTSSGPSASSPKERSSEHFAGSMGESGSQHHAAESSDAKDGDKTDYSKGRWKLEELNMLLHVARVFVRHELRVICDASFFCGIKRPPRAIDKQLKRLLQYERWAKRDVQVVAETVHTLISSGNFGDLTSEQQHKLDAAANLWASAPTDKPPDLKQGGRAGPMLPLSESAVHKAAEVAVLTCDAAALRKALATAPGSLEREQSPRNVERRDADHRLEHKLHEEVTVTAVASTALAVAAAVQKQGTYGFSLLHAACSLPDAQSSTQLEIVMTLLDKGAHVNAMDPGLGYTALHWACTGNNPDLVRLLLARGADLTMETLHNQSCLDLALAHHQAAILHVLLTHQLEASHNREDVHVRESNASADLLRVLRTDLDPLVPARMLEQGRHYTSRKWRDRFVGLSRVADAIAIWRDAQAGDLAVHVFAIVTSTSPRSHANDPREEPALLNTSLSASRGSDSDSFQVDEDSSSQVFQDFSEDVSSDQDLMMRAVLQVRAKRVSRVKNLVSGTPATKHVQKAQLVEASRKRGGLTIWKGAVPLERASGKIFVPFGNLLDARLALARGKDQDDEGRIVAIYRSGDGDIIHLVASSPDEAQTWVSFVLWESALDAATNRVYLFKGPDRRATWAPKEWVKSKDPKRQLFFYCNTLTHTSQWTPPVEAPRAIESVVQAAHLGELLNVQVTSLEAFAQLVLQDNTLLVQLAERVLPGLVQVPEDDLCDLEALRLAAWAAALYGAGPTSPSTLVFNENWIARVSASLLHVHNVRIIESYLALSSSKRQLDPFVKQAVQSPRSDVSLLRSIHLQVCDAAPLRWPEIAEQLGAMGCRLYPMQLEIVQSQTYCSRVAVCAWILVAKHPELIGLDKPGNLGRRDEMHAIRAWLNSLDKFRLAQVGAFTNLRDQDSATLARACESLFGAGASRVTSRAEVLELLVAKRLWTKQSFPSPPPSLEFSHAAGMMSTQCKSVLPIGRI